MFTTKAFKKGDFLLHYKGELITGMEGEAREQRYPEDAGNFLYFFKENGKTCWYVTLYEVLFYLWFKIIM